MTDSINQPLVGSKVMLRPYDAPYFSGSYTTIGIPVVVYSDITGLALFPRVVQGIYRVDVFLPTTTNQLQNYANEIFYIDVQETSGSTVNGINYRISGP